MDKERVLVAMSGGVDSSVCAALLLNDGYTVIGATMKLWRDGDVDDSRAIDDAKAVCDALGIEHIVIDLKQNFYDYVVTPFIDQYLSGKTPNPCVICNKYIKFGALFDEAEKHSCHYLATGHYAVVECGCNGRYILKKSPNKKKDQSYFLYGLSQQRLSRIMFPIGHYSKDETRDMAHRFNLPVADKAESQEICFIPDNDYQGFISRIVKGGCTAGDILDSVGNVIGRHNGIAYYTIGQRKGLGAFGKPMFVTSIDSTSNTITLGEKGSEYFNGLIAADLNFIAIGKLPLSLRCEAKIRYKAPPAPCSVTPKDDKVTVLFDKPQRAVTPGQAVVFYDGDAVLFGGTIEESF